jgi:hypothetical protein
MEAAIIVFQKAEKTTVISQTESKQRRKMRESQEDKGKRRRLEKTGEGKIYLAS